MHQEEESKPVYISSYHEFWQWFQLHQQDFFETVKQQENVDELFLTKLTPMLQQLNDDFYCVTGMLDEQTAELIITAEGIVKEFIFVEELIAAAPQLPNWKFTALKPPCDIESMGIVMDGYEFNDDNISFYSNDHPLYPDEIDITLVHKEFREENQETITSGCMIYLDNMLGEYNTATILDTVQVAAADENTELIPIDKLQGYLLWRQKEFVEKYDGVRYGTENDNHYSFEAEDENGLPVYAILNRDLMQWDAKASHPWMMLVEIKYNMDENETGMPSDEETEQMNLFVDNLRQQLPDEDGYLNIGNETYNGVCTVYFACKEFRRSSKTTATLIKEFSEQLEISYSIFKDKYWITLNHLQPSAGYD